MLAPVPAILTPASPADRDIAKTDYQILTLFVSGLDFYSPSRYLFIVLQWRHRQTAEPDHCSALRLRLYSAPQILQITSETIFKYQ